MEENIQNTAELEELRQQMEMFKNKLDKQQIVNEQLVRNTMRNKMSWIKNYVWFEIIAVPFLLLFFAVVHYHMGLSWALFAFLAIGLTADVIGDYIVNCIPKSQLLSGDLVATSKKLTTMKKKRTQWFIIGVVFCLIWTVWFVVEMLLKANAQAGPNQQHFQAIMLISAMLIGGVVGFVISWFIFRKMQRTNNEIIEQINQVTQENDVA